MTRREFLRMLGALLGWMGLGVQSPAMVSSSGDVGELQSEGWGVPWGVPWMVGGDEARPGAEEGGRVYLPMVTGGE